MLVLFEKRSRVGFNSAIRSRRLLTNGIRQELRCSISEVGLPGEPMPQAVDQAPILRFRLRSHGIRAGTGSIQAWREAGSTQVLSS